MKQCLSLYKRDNNKYSSARLCSPSSLYDLYMFISNDYHSWDQEIFTKTERILNITYVYNDLKNQIAYIGLHYDDEDHELFQLNGSDLVNYVNEKNSCKIRHDNFQEFIPNWLEIKKQLPPFVIIYRDDNDWISCKSFDSQEKMELFTKNYKAEVIY